MTTPAVTYFQCHQQLARQCDYGRLFMTAAVARNPFFNHKVSADAADGAAIARRVE